MLMNKLDLFTSQFRGFIGKLRNYDYPFPADLVEFNL